MRSPSLLLALALAASGCASIVASGPDLVPINSSPEGARITMDGIAVGRTPAVVPFDRARRGIVRLELDGFEPASYDVDRVLNGWFLGNIIFGGVIGIVVDLVTENFHKYPEDPVFVELRPVGGR